MEADRQTLVLEQKVDHMTIAPPLMGTDPAEHPVLGLPFAAEIDGRNYRGEGISLTRAEIVGLIDPHLDAASRLVTLQFAFDGFTVALAVECVIDAPSGAGRAVLAFRDPAGDHLPQLRHLLNSWVAGDVVAMGPVLGISTQRPAAKPKAAAGEGSSLIRRLAGASALALLTGVLVLSVARIGYARLYAVQVPVAAQAVTQGQTLRAVAAGQIGYVNAQADVGEVAFTLATIGGPSVSIAMPCDCVGQLTGKGVGDTVLAGDPVMTLAAPDAPLVLGLSLPREYLYELAAADHLTAEFPDGQTLRLHADPTSLGAVAATGKDVTVQLLPETAIPAERQGQLASLTIVRPTPRILAPLVDFIETIGF
jgi:alginate biosynthesis protein Alg44